MSLNELPRAWRQPDAKPLEGLHSPESPRDFGTIFMPDIWQRCLELGFISLLDQNLNAEQEREVDCPYDMITFHTAFPLFRPIGLYEPYLWTS